MKKVLCMLFALVLTVCLSPPAFADDFLSDDFPQEPTLPDDFFSDGWFFPPYDFDFDMTAPEEEPNNDPKRIIDDRELEKYGMSQMTRESYSTDDTYVPESAIDGILAKMEKDGTAAILKSYGLTPDTSTLMPLYYCDITVYAERNEIECVPFIMNGKPMYICDVLDEDGNFAGVAEFNTAYVRTYMPSRDRNQSVDFVRVIDRVLPQTDKDIDLPAAEAKIMRTDGVGYVFYVKCKTGTFLISTGFNEENSELFTPENGGVIEPGGKLKKVAKEQLEIARAASRARAAARIAASPRLQAEERYRRFQLVLIILTILLGLWAVDGIIQLKFDDEKEKRKKWHYN